MEPRNVGAPSAKEKSGLLEGISFSQSADALALGAVSWLREDPRVGMAGNAIAAAAALLLLLLALGIASVPSDDEDAGLAAAAAAVDRLRLVGVRGMLLLDRAAALSAEGVSSMRARACSLHEYEAWSISDATDGRDEDVEKEEDEEEEEEEEIDEEEEAGTLDASSSLNTKPLLRFL